ncbi:alpha/beta fold hydrolase [Enterovirga sp. CN4-39]|uniref:alpha/beta fold hydrolase n=1 Tax=Enterovirga sp. CN4-39 TaxID=3400910 RepID=UPI003C07364B
MNILLIPGFMTDGSLWDEVAPELAVLGPVIRGDPGRSSTIREMAEDMLRQAPDRFALIGFSMGGYVAREMVRIAPERIVALVLIATSARADTPEQARRKIAAASAVDPARFGGVSRAAILASLHPARSGDEALIERVRAMSERVGGEVFRRQAAQLRAGDLDGLAAIRCPTLIVAADRDALRSREEAEELHHGIPGSTLVLIEGSGHMIPIEEPEQLVAAILPWLRAQADGDRSGG